MNKATSRLLVAALAVSFLEACNIFGAGAESARVNPGPTDWGQQPRAYPAALDPAAIHDIQVFREGTRLRLTNTTATSYGSATIWINRRYARDIETFATGQSLDLDLNQFVDQFSRAFKAGGFFATKKPDPVVIVELETRPDSDDESTTIHGLILVRDEVD